MVEQGETVDKALMRLTPPIIFFRKSSFKMQVSLWPKERLFSVLELLYKCERDCKSTNMPVEEIVSYTLMQIGSAAAKLNRRGY
jgi:DNA polymerase III delta subunit